MDESIIDSGSAGHPVLLEHLIWLLGHPGTWFTLLVWILCVIGAIKLGRLIKARFGSSWFAAYFVSALALILLYAFVLKQGFDTFVRGIEFGEMLPLLPVMSLALNLLALASAIWIITDFLKRRRT